MTTRMNQLSLTPLENDDWYDMHVVPKINEIEYQDSGHYFINVMLCWNRHRFRDAYEGKLSLAVFQGQLWCLRNGNQTSHMLSALSRL